MSEPAASSATRALARLAARPVDDEARAQALRFVIDTLGCIAGARAAPEGRILRATHGASTSGVEERAFVWGALAHTLELDDLHRASVTHPACVVIPAALALARERRAELGATLDAIVRGYEVMTRVGEAVGPAHYRIFHNTATCGPFGAAAAGAALLGLDEERTVWALGNAGTVAGGLWQFNVEATATKPLHAGHAARTGVTAARLAAAGLSGPAHILEGAKGFFAGFCGDARPEALVAPSPGWKVTETSIKPWGSCRHTHPAIDAALRLAPRLASAAVAEVVVRGYRTIGELCDAPAPASSARARFSVQHCVAVALARGAVELGAFEPGAILEPAIAGLRARVRFEVAPRFDAAYPGRWGSEVAVRLADGRELRAEALAPRGDPEAPLGDDELDAKARALIAHGLGWGADGSADAVAALREPGSALTAAWRLLDAATGSDDPRPAR